MKVLLTFFSENINAILAHAQEEVTEFLDKFENDKLLMLRNDLYSNLQNVLSNLKSKELYSRRKRKLIALDIYYIAFSLVNKQEHVSLQRMLKAEGTNNLAVSADAASEVIEETEVLQVCMKLKSDLDSVIKKMNQAEQRIELLELENTQLMVKTRSLEQKLFHLEVDSSYDESVNTGGELEEVKTTNPKEEKHVAETRVAVEQQKEVSEDNSAPQILNKPSDQSVEEMIADNVICHKSKETTSVGTQSTAAPDTVS